MAYTYVVLIFICNNVLYSFQIRYTICQLRFYGDCFIRVPRFFIQNVISFSYSNFNKANPAPFMLKYNLQPVVTSFISIAVIMMMTIGASRS